MRLAARGAGKRSHVLLATVTLCGLIKADELMFPSHAAPRCSNCALKLARLQRRNRRTNLRLRARD